MSKPADEDGGSPKGAAPRENAGPGGDGREARLAAALRANLRRRKAAARTAAPTTDPKD